MENVYFWFRRDLRLKDNVGLMNATNSGKKVQCVFIFDTNILDQLPEDDARVTFIHDQLSSIDKALKEIGSSLLVRKGKPVEVWKELLTDKTFSGIYVNRDYEPYARERDKQVYKYCEVNGISYCSFKDQVIFERKEVVKDDGKPYTVYTPFKKKWRSHFRKEMINEAKVDLTREKFIQKQNNIPSLEEIGFKRSSITVKDYTLHIVRDYDLTRNNPAADKTSYLSVHLRFGTISIREIIRQTIDLNDTFVDELIWREFFMQILFHFPDVITNNFRRKYDGIQWRNNELEFKKWCDGNTGYPMVDAGMRQLNKTGYMHNRVRMVVASFLCKHLLVDWKWGEAYFAEKLLDYELSSNNGNWQWAAGSGCDASPYFRVFNPTSQQEKFDPKLIYIRRWIDDIDELTYPQPIVDHKMARERAIKTYKDGILNE